MNWEITDIDALGRIGKLTVNKKEMVTPNLFPVVHPYKNIINTSDLKKIGAQCVFTNAYILYQNLQERESVLKSGIHNYLNFDGIIATDSGAFQKYMYNKTDIEINAEIIESFQEDIGSDFPVILDVPIQPDDDYETAKEKVYLSIQRAKENIIRRINQVCHWFGPIHGAKYLDLLKISTNEMSKLDFDIYAVGGLVKSLLSYRFDLVIKILLNVKKNLVWNKPVHMFGLGLPQFFSLAVACGCDLMDSAAYVLFAKENRYFTLSTGTSKLEELEEFPCHCPICCEYKPKEVISFEEELRTELLAKHNLHISFSELRTVRQAIKEGNLWELVEQRVRNHPTLVDALNAVKSDLPFLEKYEKIYKPHGRLYASLESVDRPMLHRFATKLKNNYRVPQEAKFLILIPELDVKGYKSPSTKNWLDELNSNTIIPRELLHIALISGFYGIIPFELASSFPMGQYESIEILEANSKLYRNLEQKVKIFFDLYNQNYIKYGVLVPERYINQFNEETIYLKKDILNKLFDDLSSELSITIPVFHNLSELLDSFKVE
ncbi:MAG: tRNA guanosine(15) transglycosylase TgtA [Candidatus Lokiarchaeota archaeon]|nr:tRNA guanosine(15) transglycosylase TgtA [Candidatus Lokiarchaeota archaeon]